MTTGLDYIYVDEPQVHAARRRIIAAAHPEVRSLVGPHWSTPVGIFAVVAAQVALSALFADLPWWAILALAYVVGAVLNHALYVMIHECTHNLAFRPSWANKVMGMVCDIPLIIPSALSFRKYHMIHHRHLGELDMDPDLVTGWEARVVGNSAPRKALWLAFFSISQAMRPTKLKHVKMWDGWIIANTLVQLLVVDVLLWIFIGPMAVFYMVLSTLFALGLHPLGGRWIQEHYSTTPAQETFSYYGLGNLVAFNIGYHNEHHDFMSVPWIHLPKIRRMGAEHYRGLHSYRSWTAVLLRFIFDREMSSYSRIVHPGTRRTSTAA